MDRQSQSSASLLEQHNTLIAEVLTHFRNLTIHATTHGDTERDRPDTDTIAVNGLTMQMEFEALNNTIKDLLALSRRLKELWVFGPPGKEIPGAAAQATQVDRDVARVAELLSTLEAKNLGALAVENGGTWKSEARLGGDGS